MDFCAGVGGGRLGLTNNGLKCVGFSEIDKAAEKTYRLIHNAEEEKNWGDLTKIETKKLPNFDFLIAGFPCQTFSVIGGRKGMEDQRGQIIFHLIKTLQEKNVKYFLLENVKGLINHDKGDSLKIILKSLKEAGYTAFYKVLNSIHYGVPQMRERVYFVGFKTDIVGENFHFSFPNNNTQKSNISDSLIDEKELTLCEKKTAYETFLRYLNNKYNKGKFSVEKLLNEENLVLDTRQSDLRLYRNRVPTLRLGRHGILYIKNKKFRKLSGYESFLLQGFPKELALKAKENIPDRDLLRQAGNAMTVTTIQAIGEKMIESINNLSV